MRKLLLILPLLLAACARPLIIEKLQPTENKIEMFGVTPQRTFYYDLNLPDSLKEKEVLKTYGSYTKTMPLFYNKYVFIPDLAGRIYSFNYLTGKQIGFRKIKGEMAVTPVLHRTRIFLAVNNYNENTFDVEFYDYKIGMLISNYSLKSAVHNEMIKLKDGFLIVADNGTIYKFNFIGRIVKTIRLKEEVRSTPAMYDGFLIVLTKSGKVVLVDVEKEKVVFKKKIAGMFESGVTVQKGVAFFGSEEGEVFAFSIKKKKILWKQATGYPVKVIPVTNGKTIYVGNLNGDVYAFENGTGKLIWTKRFGGLINTTPALFKNVLLQPNLQNKLLFINPETGELLKTIKYKHRLKMIPAYFNNLLFVGADKGEMFVYGEENEN